MTRYPVYPLSNPDAAKLIKKRLADTKQSQSTIAAFLNYILTLKEESPLFEFQVRCRDKGRGPGLTLRYNGHRIGYIDIEDKITCKLITNGKPLSSFHNATSCNALGHKGSEGFMVRISEATELQLFFDTLHALDITHKRKPAKAVTSVSDRIRANFLTKNTAATPLPASTRQPLPDFQSPAIGQYEPNPNDQVYTAEEGEDCYRTHRSKERNHKLVIEKKKRALKSDPLLRCEVCGFSFVQTYGEWGKHFAEVHHKVPLSSLTTATETKLKDLALVCSNCHSILHRQGHRTLTIEELRQIIDNAKL